MNSNQTEECATDALYGPGETPAALLWLGVVHNCCVATLGTLSNTVALWCVVSCTKTRRPVKVLLLCVFVPILVICVVSRPLVIEQLLGLLSCDTERISKTVTLIHLLSYSILAQSELGYIASIAVIRAAAVWSSQKCELSMRVAAALAFSVFAYSCIAGVVILGAVLTNRVEGKTKDALGALYFFLATMVPVLVTIISYALMILAVQRNKRRLAATQHRRSNASCMDQATRAMLAVFISNLIFSLPHSIYHLMGRQPYYMHVIFHVLFSAHFVVDPLAFIYFNLHHRRRVLDLLVDCKRRMGCQLPPPATNSVNPIPSSSTPLSSITKDTTS